MERRKAECRRSLALPPRNGEDRAANELGAIGAAVQTKPQHGDDDRRQVDAELRQNKIEEEQLN